MLGDASVAERATQRTFVQAWKHGPSFDPSHGLEPWLVTIASWVRRRADLEDIAGVDHVLAEIDASAKELGTTNGSRAGSPEHL